MMKRRPRLHENMSFPEALRYLAKKYNIEIQEKELTAEELASRQVADSLYIVNDYARSYFENQLFILMLIVTILHVRR